MLQSNAKHCSYYLKTHRATNIDLYIIKKEKKRKQFLNIMCTSWHLHDSIQDLQVGIAHQLNINAVVALPVSVETFSYLLGDHISIGVQSMHPVRPGHLAIVKTVAFAGSASAC